MASVLAGHLPGLKFPPWMDRIDEHSQPSSSGMVLATAATIVGRLDDSHETLNTLLPASEGSWGESLTAAVGSVFSGHNSGIWKTYPLRKRITAFSRANTYDGRPVAKVKSPQDLETDTNGELHGSGSGSVLNPSTSSLAGKMKRCPLDDQDDTGLAQSALLGAEYKDVVAAPKIGRPSLRRGRRRPPRTCGGILRDPVSCEEPRKRRLASLTAQTLVNLLMEKEEEEDDDVLEKCARRDKEWSMDVEESSCSAIVEDVAQGCSGQCSPCHAMASEPGEDCSMKQASQLSVREIANNDTKCPLDLNCSIESPPLVVQCVPDMKNDQTSAHLPGCLLRSQAIVSPTYQVENTKNNVLCTAPMDFPAQDAPLDLSIKSRKPIGIRPPEDYRDREKCFPSGYSRAADISTPSSNLSKVPSFSGTFPVGIANEEQAGFALSSCSTFQGSFLYSRSTLPSSSQTHPVGGGWPTSSGLPANFDTCHLAPGMPVWATPSPPFPQFNRVGYIGTAHDRPVGKSKCMPSFLNYSDSWLSESMCKYHFGLQKVARTDTDLGMVIGGCGVSPSTTSMSTPSVSPPHAHSAPPVRFPTSVPHQHAVQPIHGKNLAQTDFQSSPAASFSPPCQSVAKDFRLDEITQRLRVHGEAVQHHDCFVPIVAALTEGLQPSTDGEHERMSVVQKQRVEFQGRAMPGSPSNHGSVSLRGCKSVVDSNTQNISTRHPPLPKLVIKVSSSDASIVDTLGQKSAAQIAEPASTWRRRQGGDGLRGRRGPGRPPRHFSAVDSPPGGRQFPVAKRRGTNGWLPVGEPFYNAVYIAGESEPAVRRCFPAVQRDGLAVKPRDCVLLRSGLRRRSLPYIAKISALWENPRTGELTMSLFWYYRPEHTQGGRPAYPKCEKNEVFASRHQDENSVACIEEKCYVLTLAEYCRFWAGMKLCQNSAAISSARSLVPAAPAYLAPIHRRVPPRTDPELIFLCRAVYDFRHHRLLKNPPRSSPSPTPPLSR